MHGGVNNQEIIRLREKNAQLTASITDSKHIMKHQQHKVDTLQERQEMLEQLNQTLEEEKKTLLLQVNKLLEQNQSLLYRSLENRDQELEEERIFSDKLGELEKEKNKLSERLIHQEKESMAREIDLLRKREKRKNILRKGFKKLKDKFQTNSYKIPEVDGPMTGPSSFSPHHYSTSTLPPSFLSRNDGSSLSSNQSISSNSHHSGQSGGSNENLDPMGSAPDINQFVPRAPILGGNSPVTLRQRKAWSVIVPSTSDSTIQPLTLPAERQSQLLPDVMSLEEFLAETNKTPNRRKLMEIKRASFVTPPVTPRSSMHFGLNQIGGVNSYTSMMGGAGGGAQFDQADIQDFLRKLQVSDDTLSIPEVEEPDMRYEGDNTSEHSYTSSGSTTQEENTPQEINISGNNNNNNNNNNNEDVTPTISPLSLSPSSSVAVSVSNQKGSGQYSPIVRVGSPFQLVSAKTTPPLVSSQQTTPILHSSQTTPFPQPNFATPISSPSEATPTINQQRIERRRFYNSLADLTTRKFTERLKNSHKSTENLTSPPNKEDKKKRGASLYNSSNDDNDSNETSSVKRSTPVTTGKRKLFHLWRKSSQSSPPLSPLSPTLDEQGESSCSNNTGAVMYV